MNETIKLPKRQASEISKLCTAYYNAPIIRGGAETPQKTAARKAYGEHSAKLAKRHFALDLTTEEAFRAVDYHQTDWIMRNPGSCEERLDLLTALLRNKTTPDFDQPFAENLTAKNLFSTLYFLHDYRKGNRPVGTADCGGSEVKDTARGLYRLLFLSGPVALDLSDMYKTGSFIDLLSRDGSFCAHAELWKYELKLRFSATAEHITGRRSGVVAGNPTARNGVHPKSPLLKKWCDTLVLALNSKWDVYSGNGFVV